eukprot:4680156-Ditylum_brightwellii.AAC.1
MKANFTALSNLVMTQSEAQQNPAANTHSDLDVNVTPDTNFDDILQIKADFEKQFAVKLAALVNDTEIIDVIKVYCWPMPWARLQFKL